MKSGVLLFLALFGGANLALATDSKTNTQFNCQPADPKAKNWIQFALTIQGESAYLSWKTPADSPAMHEFTTSSGFPTLMEVSDKKVLIEWGDGQEARVSVKKVSKNIFGGIIRFNTGDPSEESLKRSYYVSCSPQEIPAVTKDLKAVVDSVMTGEIDLYLVGEACLLKVSEEVKSRSLHYWQHKAIIAEVCADPTQLTGKTIRIKASDLVSEVDPARVELVNLKLTGSHRGGLLVYRVKTTVKSAN